MALVVTGCGKQKPNQQSTDISNESDSGSAASLQSPGNTLLPNHPPKGLEPNDPLEQDYVGHSLHLYHHTEKNLGSLKIENDDAKILYNALEIQEESLEKSTALFPATSKKGKHIVCYKERARFMFPRSTDYSCYIDINYLTGTVFQQTADIKEEQHLIKLYDGYFSENLILMPSTSSHWGVFRIRGEDAQILYDILGSDGRDVKCEMDHKAQDPSNTPDYICSVDFSYTTGTLIK